MKNYLNLLSSFWGDLQFNDLVLIYDYIISFKKDREVEQSKNKNFCRNLNVNSQFHWIILYTICLNFYVEAYKIML